ncbi:MAG: branched-chain amino acid transporter permease [Prevotella sp.]|nr:branched-chain amino acid transporter permease [Prevotella sp.]
MTQTEQIITIALMALMTVATRALPFIIFPPGHTTPRYITYLGRVLPLAVFGMLVVYCLKDVQWLSGTHGVPELIGITATILVHLWRRQMLWSIAAGTIVYLLIIRLP